MSPAPGADDPQRDAAPGGPPGERPPAEQAPASADPAEPSAEPEDVDDAGEYAWDSRRGLYRHSPGFMFNRSAHLGGSLVGGDQHGVSGGNVTGDVILGGSKVEYHFGGSAEETSGEIAVAEVEALARHFVYPAAPEDDRSAESDASDEAWRPDSPFGIALDQLRRRRVAIVSGPAATGRGSAALMLLRAVGVTHYRKLDPAITPGRLPAELRPNCGHIVADFVTNAERPLREHHVRAISDKLRSHGGYLVIVVGPHPVVEGIGHVPWQPPEPERILRGHLDADDLAGHTTDELLSLPPVTDMLAYRRPIAELVDFARRIAAYARGATGLADLAAFGSHAAEQQVRRWFDGGEQTLHDKAFLVALATFDEAPYALAAEAGDTLFTLLQRIEKPGVPASIPVFGTSSAQRVELAQADRYEETEESEWGPVRQTKIQFRDPRTAATLLHEVWTGHPSARPAVTAWLRQLALDSRPIVRTRAASTTAVLAHADLPATMSLLIAPWAAHPRFRARLAAANALALAHRLNVRHVPRILREWCTSPEPHLRWTAVRTYALVGETFPDQAVAALADAARGLDGRHAPNREQVDELHEIAQSAAALLLAAGQDAIGGGPAPDSEGDGGEGDAGERDGGERDGGDATDRTPGNAALRLWPDLEQLLRDRTTREFVLATFIYAIGPTDGPSGSGRPLLLDLFARADPTPGTPGALVRQSLAALWRSVLTSTQYSPSALDFMRRWVKAADVDQGAEDALAELLPALVASAEDAKRLAYLLDNPRDPETTPSPTAAAKRLRALLPVP